jgi:hypothetical protein
MCIFAIFLVWVQELWGMWALMPTHKGVVELRIGWSFE